MKAPPAASTVVLALALLPAVAGPVPAQTGEDVLQDPYTETLDVQVVNVEVRVTDRKGRPVTGLSREDFELYEDGRRVQIEYFSEVRGGRAPGGEAEAARGSTSPAAGGPGLEAPPSAQLRNFVLFLDLDHLGPGSLRGLRPGLEGLVREVLDPGDRVMVVVRQGNLRVALELTDDAAQVAQTLEEVFRTGPAGIHGETERRQVLRGLRLALEHQDAAPGCTETESLYAEQLVRQYADSVGSQVQGTIGALTSLVRALVGIPGPKVVIYAGEGLEQRPALDLFHLLVDLCPVRERELQANLLESDLSSSFQALTADANANRVTFYTLDAGGLRADSSAEDADGLVRLSTVGRRIRAANLQHPLFLMAHETGGRAIFNANRFTEELDGIVRDVETYYSLGFVPDHEGDGEVHRLRVKVLANHHDARYRLAYRDKPLDERIVESMLGTLLFGVEDNPLGVEVEVVDAEAGEGGLLEVPVRIRVPLRHVVANPGAGFSVGRLRLVLVARNPEGEWTPVKQQGAFFKVPEGQDPGRGVRHFEVSMDLPPGENVVAVGVRDEIGGETSYLRTTFDVQDRRRVSGSD